jgi:hypothetical protein
MFDRGASTRAWRRYAVDRHLALPNQPYLLEGAGIERAHLTFHGTDGLVGNYTSFYQFMPFNLRDLTLSTTGQGTGTALSLTFPTVPSVNEPTVFVERVTVRPEPTTASGVTFRNGMRFDNCWNMRLRDSTVHSDNTAWDLEVPFLMETAIAFYRGCQDVKLSGVDIYAAPVIGVLVEAREVGHGEGFHMTQGHIVGANICVKLDSVLPHGWPTPWFSISKYHLYHHYIGLLAIGRSEGDIEGNHICASAQTFGGVGAYIAGGCRDISIRGNTFTTNSYRPGHGIVVDASERILIEGNKILTHYGIWLTPSSRNCVVGVNTYGPGCQVPIIDQGFGNRVARTL